jgi:hypothetical protein
MRYENSDALLTKLREMCATGSSDPESLRIEANSFLRGERRLVMSDMGFPDKDKDLVKEYFFYIWERTPEIYHGSLLFRFCRQRFDVVEDIMLNNLDVVSEEAFNKGFNKTFKEALKGAVMLVYNFPWDGSHLLRDIIATGKVPNDLIEKILMYESVATIPHYLESILGTGKVPEEVIDNVLDRILYKDIDSALSAILGTNHVSVESLKGLLKKACEKGKVWVVNEIVKDERLRDDVVRDILLEFISSNSYYSDTIVSRIVATKSLSDDILIDVLRRACDLEQVDVIKAAIETGVLSDEVFKNVFLHVVGKGKGSIPTLEAIVKSGVKTKITYSRKLGQWFDSEELAVPEEVKELVNKIARGDDNELGGKIGSVVDDDVTHSTESQDGIEGEPGNGSNRMQSAGERDKMLRSCMESYSSAYRNTAFKNAAIGAAITCAFYGLGIYAEILPSVLCALSAPVMLTICAFAGAALSLLVVKDSKIKDVALEHFKNNFSESQLEPIASSL